MASSKDFPSGDYTESALFPKIRYGQPDKADILNAQNIVAGKAFAAEAKESATFRKRMENELGGVKAMLKLLLEKEGFDAEAIAALSPTKASPTKVRFEEINQLGKSFHDNIYQATSEFAGNDDKKLVSVRTEKVVKLVEEEWFPFMKNKLEDDHVQTLEAQDEDHRVAIYLRAAGNIKKARKDAAKAALEGDQQEQLIAEEDQAMIDGMDVEMQAQIVQVTKELKQQAPDVIVTSSNDSVALTGALNAWMTALESAFATTEEATLMTVKGMTETQQSALYFHCIAQVVQDENTDAASQLFDKNELVDFSQEFISQVFKTTRKLATSNPDKVKVMKSAKINEHVKFWTEYIKKSNEVDLDANGTVDGDRGFPHLMKMTDDERANVYLAFTKLAKGSSKPVRPSVPSRNSRSASPTKTTQAPKPGTPGAGLHPIPDLSPAAAAAAAAAGQAAGGLGGGSGTGSPTKRKPGRPKKNVTVVAEDDDDDDDEA